jgi:hypothetical protein
MNKIKNSDEDEICYVSDNITEEDAGRQMPDAGCREKYSSIQHLVLHQADLDGHR